MLGYGPAVRARSDEEDEDDMSTPYPGGPPPQWPPAGGPPPGPDPYGGGAPDPYGGGAADPYGAGPDPYGGGPAGPYGGGPGWPPPPGGPGGPGGLYGGGPGWPPPGAPGGPGGPGGPPAPRRRTGRVLVLVAAAVVLVLVAGAALVALTRGSDPDQVDFGAGPSGEPEEEWTVDLGPEADRSITTDGDRVYVVREEEPEDEESYERTGVVTAYAAEDGEELWEHELVDGYASSDVVRPLGDDQVLVAGYGDDTTALLDATSGDVVWEVDGEPVDTEVSLGLSGPFGRTAPPDVLLMSVDDDDETRVAVVDRADGDELWDVTGDDALLCGDVVVTSTEGEQEDEDSFEPVPSEIAGHDAATGDELWSLDGVPGLCDEDQIAIGTSDEELALVDVASGDEGETFPVAGSGQVYGIPFGDHVVVSAIDFLSEEPSVSVAVHPRNGGDATFEDDDAFAIPISDDLLITADQEGEEVRLIRASDGEEVGSQDFGDADGSCDGALTTRTAIFCEEGDPDVTAFALDDGFEELWSVDVGAGVLEATVGGDRLFAVTEDEELVALR